MPWLPRILTAARAETEEHCRDALGESAFHAAYGDARELDLDAAVTYAVRARDKRKRPSTGWHSLPPNGAAIRRACGGRPHQPEIAGTLLMGGIGVTTHLSHIFTKLGITNRSKLAAEARAPPVDPAGRCLLLWLRSGSSKWRLF